MRFPAIRLPGVERFLPFLAWLPGVKRDDLRADLIAGLTGAVVVLPQGVAFATIAGMPPEYGLYAGMIPAIIAALFGSSRLLVSGPTTAASIVMLSSLSSFADPGTVDYVSLALTLTFMVGVIELALGLARMGALVNFISHSVIVGFTAGAAILIAAKQLKHFFGVEIARGGHLHDILFQFTEQLASINPWVTIVGAMTLFSGIAIKHKYPRLPYMILAMIVGSLVAAILNLVLGVDVTHIKTVGALPRSLPPLSSPDFSMETIKNLSTAALAVSLFALTEAVSIGRSLATKTGTRVDGNQEFIGQGLSNIFGSFFSGYVATGSFNRSGLNYQAGARTPLAAMFAGVLLIGVVLLVAPLVAYLPNAAMSGVLFLVAWGLIDFKEIMRILKVSMGETTILAITFLGALFLELEMAIFAGVLLSLIIYLEKVSHPRVTVRKPDPRLYKRSMTEDADIPECPQLKFLNIEGPIFFGCTNYIQTAFDRFRETDPQQKHLLLLSQGIGFVDLQGGDALVTEARRRKADGGGLYMVNADLELWDSLERSGCLDGIGERHLFQSKTAAIHGIFQKLDKDICASCDKRIFRECKELEN